MKKLIPFIIAGSLIVSSCTKEEPALREVNLKSPAEEIIIQEGNVDNFIEAADYEADLFSMGEALLTGSSLKNGSIGESNFRNLFQNMYNFRLRYRDGNGPNVSFTTTNGTFPKTLTIDYGTGIELTNGRTLSGKIIIVISGPITESGMTRTITYENFSNGFITLSGTAAKTLVINTENKIFGIKSNMTVTFQDSTAMTRTEEKTMTWNSGIDTPFNPADDVIQITGSVKVKDRKGNEYTRIITSPLIKTGECRFIIQGIIEFKTSEGRFALLDYGTGECDNIATRTTAAGTKEITLGH